MTKQTFLTLVGISCILFVAFTVISFQHEINRKKLPILGHVQAFKLIDSNGEGFDSAKKLNNNVWIANFFFTTCSDICPMLSKNMASLSRSFQLVNDIILVSFSVNPEQDTPETLKSYAQKFGAQKNWYFLTGERDALNDIIVGDFKLGHKDEPAFHSSYFALVDRYGYIRGYYDGTQTEEVNKLFKDAAKLKKE